LSAIAVVRGTRILTDDNATTGSIAGNLVRAILGLLALGLFVLGLLPYGAAVGTWFDAGFVFRGFHLIDWLVGLLGAGLMAIGAFLGGICLRLLHWKHAPLASLGLSIVATALVMATLYIFSKTNTSEDSIEVVLLKMVSVVVLLLTALPPFLHWLLARRKREPIPTTVAHHAEPRP
jgi:hypothetical protein